MFGKYYTLIVYEVILYDDFIEISLITNQ